VFKNIQGASDFEPVTKQLGKWIDSWEVEKETQNEETLVTISDSVASW